jgi:tetratricopeptide (TPR) repeat protein
LINLEDNEDKKIEIIKQLVLKFKDVDPSFYEQLGDYYYKNQDLNNALDYYLKLVSIIPTKKTVLFKIANIYYNKNDFSNALNYINLAIKLDDNPDYYYFKGEILLALNELNQALESFKLAYDKYNDISLKAKALTKIKNTQDLINKINKNKN